MKKGILSIIVSDEIIKNYLTKNIEELIGREVEVVGYSVTENLRGPYGSDLVLIFDPNRRQDAEKYFPNTPILYASRRITGENLEKIMMVPNGSRALVVNYPEKASNEIIEVLLSLGLDHLKYDSYYRGKPINTSDYDLIVTPGMSHICPEGIEPIIDIGIRGISYHTFSQIVNFFDLDQSYMSNFEHNYIKQHVFAAQKIKASLDSSEQLKSYQSVILNGVDEGILAFDENGHVAIANPMVMQLFGSFDNLMSNDKLRKILHQMNTEPTYPDEESNSESTAIKLIRYDNKHIFCRRTMIEASTDSKHVLYTFKNVDQIQTLEQSVRKELYNKGFKAKYTFDDIWGANPNIKRIKDKAKHFASTNQTVLITGESGTGKELLAQAIHNSSQRANKPFIAVNLSAISQDLLVSELFGYQEGAFTGAKKGGKQGYFELAHGGTLFLDEIGDAPLHIQLLLLRVIEEREFTRVGGETSIPIDIRIIAATNKNLEEEIECGRFRLDLYYRLNVFPLRTIPLRHMHEEILSLAENFALKKFGYSKKFSTEVSDALQRYDWPGNFREFNNVIEYIYNSSFDKEMVSFDDLPEYLMEKLSANAIYDDLINSPHMCCALEVLAQARPATLGRNILMERMAQRGYAITEGKIKGILKAFNQAGITKTGTTRQGTAISAYGTEVYTWLLSQNVNWNKEKIL